MLPTSLGAEIHAALGDYVYALEDPRDRVLFYVGRGAGDRILAHARDALATAETGAKLDRIRAIRQSCLEPKAYILRRQIGRRSSSAEIEATIIDVLLRWNVALTNLIRGAGTDCGIRTLDSIIEEHRALPLATARAAVLVNIGRTWFEGMEPDDIWDAARKWWWRCRPENRVGTSGILLLAEAQAIVRGAWSVALPPRRQQVTWDDLDESRRAFAGDVADFEPFEACCFDGGLDPEAPHLVGRHTRELPRSYGAAFRYLNC